MSLNYTPLRHKMLAAICDRRHPWAGSEAEHMVFGELREVGLIVISSETKWATAEGYDVARRWAAKHGEPT